MIDMLVHFLVTKKVKDSHGVYEVDDFPSIAINYLKTDFFFDLVTLAPYWEFLYMRFGRSQYLLLVKTLRIKNGIEALKANSYIDLIRHIIKQRVNKMIANK
jgi:hypothetical protein